MASVSHDKRTGRRTIQFVGADGKRRSIRLGKVSKKQAESAKLHVEHLIACKATGTAAKGTTAEWIAGLPGTIRRRLERAGLIESRQRRECPTLAGWVRSYIEGRSDVKPNTRRNLEQAERRLVGFFGKVKRLDEITPGDAEDFRIHQKAQGLAEGTIRRRCKRARQFFTAAMRKKIIAENPFGEIRCGNYSNPARFYFVSAEETQAVLEACPDGEWRLIFALSRYGGLRCPSEVLRLRWGDVDWGRMRFTVHATKTEHDADGGIRRVPLFPELYPYLLDAFEAAEPGAEYVITRYGGRNANLRTQFMRIITRAGLPLWPKVFQNLRSTRETELAETFPMQVVCAWIGNSPSVAAKHYLQVTEDHFLKAAPNPVQNPVQQGAVEGRIGSQLAVGQGVKAAVCGGLRPNAARCENHGPTGIPRRGNAHARTDDRDCGGRGRAGGRVRRAHQPRGPS